MCCVTFLDLCFNGNHNFGELVIEFISPCKTSATVFTHFNSALLDRIGNAFGKSPTGLISQAFVDSLANSKLEFKLQISLYASRAALSVLR
jgi:hypothetical protein